MEQAKPYVPSRTWVPKKPFTANPDRETRDERHKKEHSISRMSARRDAIEFLSGKNATEKDILELAERFHQWATQ